MHFGKNLATNILGSFHTVPKNPIVAFPPKAPQGDKKASDHNAKHLEDRLETSQAKESCATEEGIDHWIPNQSKIKLQTVDEKDNG